MVVSSSSGQDGDIVAVINDFEIYANRKEEIVARVFGVIDPGHPYISHIYSGGDWLIGGEIQLLDRIRCVGTWHGLVVWLGLVWLWLGLVACGLWLGLAPCIVPLSCPVVSCLVVSCPVNPLFLF